LLSADISSELSTLQLAEEIRNTLQILVGKLEGKRPLERPRHRWKDNIKMVIKETCRSMDWIHLAQDRDQ
jgi:hypothetical protein